MVIEKGSWLLSMVLVADVLTKGNRLSRCLQLKTDRLTMLMINNDGDGILPPLLDAQW